MEHTVGTELAVYQDRQCTYDVTSRRVRKPLFNRKAIITLLLKCDGTRAILRGLMSVTVGPVVQSV